MPLDNPDPSEPTPQKFVDGLEEIAEHCASLPVLDDRSAEEILGYGEDGLA